MNATENQNPNQCAANCACNDEERRFFSCLNDLYSLSKEHNDLTSRRKEVYKKISELRRNTAAIRECMVRFEGYIPYSRDGVIYYNLLTRPDGSTCGGPESPQIGE